MLDTLVCVGRSDIFMQKKKEEEHLYCLCRKPDDGDFMVGCDFCNEWYHGKCVGVSRKQAADIKRYSCPKCQPKQPIVYVQQRQDDDYSQGEEEEEDDEEETLPNKRKLSNGAQESQRKQARTSQEISFDTPPSLHSLIHTCVPASPHRCLFVLILHSSLLSLFSSFLYIYPLHLLLY